MAIGLETPEAVGRFHRAFTPPPALWAPWCEDAEALPFPLEMGRNFWRMLPPEALAEMRRAFYALCTHIDHQLRVVLGTLREEGLLDDMVIIFTADHGEMLGDFGLYAKRVHYEGASRVPMIVMAAAGDARTPPGTKDGRPVGLADVMPTLLDLAGVAVPESVEGVSAAGAARHKVLYGDCLDNNGATQMIHDGRHKMIWYPAGNRLQLFDLQEDPCELRDLAGDAAYHQVRARLPMTPVSGRSSCPRSSRTTGSSSASRNAKASVEWSIR